MTVVILPYWHFLVLCASLAVLVWWPGRPCVVWLVCVALLVMTLTGCAGTPEPEEPPEPLPAVVLCALPAGMTETKTEPVTPGGDYTQREVAAYATALHQWGKAGWKRVAASREWSQDCVDRAAIRDGGHAE